MNKNKSLYLKSILTVMLFIIAITWIGSNHGIKVQAASINHPTSIKQIFPDTILAEVMKNALGKADVQDVVTQNDLDQVTSIIGTSEGIQSLQGIEYLSNLIQVYLEDNNLSDISLLGGLLNLTDVYLDANPLSDISSLAKLKNLTNLYVSDCQVKDISALVGLSKLESLTADNNQISDLRALKGLTNLTTLVLYNNQIEDISALGSLNNLAQLELENQVVTNKAINYQSQVTIVNKVKDVTGALIVPTTISSNGIYKNQNIIWSLNHYSKEVTYTFQKQIMIGGSTATFSGTFHQPLKAVPNYVATTYQLITTYKDEKGKELSASLLDKNKYNINDMYSTKKVTIPGYSLIAIPTNQSGSFSANNVTVNYVYRKDSSSENYSKENKSVPPKVKLKKTLPKTGDNGDGLFVMVGLFLILSIICINKAHYKTSK
ncbi:leucine-rich repeat domain-containing protein [Listeria welshimeri]|uniref:leucine-rich repeat domain-containing protein n=1 Tax=Listeria welshimeri TaxID=1643 RepID=UPI001889061A|nr:leucine-rich repeat domain-containing protein [Listeria welshimeri]MBF2574981.1 leucine-rich repeat domain-containing protein [Listeria welshimeri]